MFDSLYSFIMMYLSMDLLFFSLLGMWGYLSLQVGVFHQSSILNHYLVKYCLCPTFYSSGAIIRFVLDLTIPPMSLKVFFIFSFLFFFCCVCISSALVPSSLDCTFAVSKRLLNLLLSFKF